MLQENNLNTPEKTNDKYNAVSIENQYQFSEFGYFDPYTNNLK